MRGMGIFSALAFRGRTPLDLDFQHNRTTDPFGLSVRYSPGYLRARLVPVRGSTPGNQLQRLCEEGQVDKALDELFHMDHEGTVPCVSTYRSLLKVCTRRKALAQAKQVHAHLAQQGLEYTAFLGDSVISTLVKCGGLLDALQLFRRLPQRTVVSWTAIIYGYTMAGHGREALRMYHRMREEGLEPSKYTFVSLLKACGTISDLDEGKRIHDDAIKYKWDTDLVVATCIVDMYSKCGSILDAQDVFDRLSDRDVVSWNAMLTAYAQQTQAEKALELYKKMLEEGICPNDRTLVSVLQACCVLAEQEQEVVVYRQSFKMKALQLGKAIHAESERNNHSNDVFVASALVSMYGKCGSLLDAQHVFDGLSQRNVVSWNAMLAVLSQQGQAENALQLYEHMLQNEGFSPNDRTFVSALQGCGLHAEKEQFDLVDGLLLGVRSIYKGKVIHAASQRKGYGSNVILSNTLVSMYGKCGSIVDAQNVFDSLVEPSLVSWNAMLAAYTQQGQAAKAFQLYKEMRKESVVPDKRKFFSALQACGIISEQEQHSVAEGQSMRDEYLQRAKAIHADAWGHGYREDTFISSTLVSVYERCGSIVDAQNVFDELAVRDVVICNAVLTAYAQRSERERALDLYRQFKKKG